MASSLPCAQCGYNLRGVPANSACPECGSPVADSLQGAAIRAGQREQAIDALRSYARSFLLSIPVGFISHPCISGPVIVVAMIGSLQRLLALRTAAASLPAKAFADTPEYQRAYRTTVAELVLGVLATAIVATPVAGVIPVAIVTQALLVGVPSLWIGTMALGMVCAHLLSEALDARFALRLERRTLPLILPFAAIVLQLATDALDMTIASSFVMGVRVASIGLWGWTAYSTGSYIGGSADELSNEPVEGALERPRDVTAAAADRVAAPRSAKSREAARRATEDDSPIPLD